MGYLTPAQLILIADKMTAWYLAESSGMAAAATAAQECEDLIIGTPSVPGLGDYVLINTLGSAFHNLSVSSTADGTAQSFMTNPFSSLENACAQAGLGLSLSTILGLETFANYYNLMAVTKWQCLFAPAFRNLWLAWRSASSPLATNFYFEVLQGATYSNGLAKKVVGGAFTAGVTIDSAKYAGGFGQVTYSGMTGSGTITVTGTWRKADGTLITASNGTYACSSASGTHDLTPPFADAILIGVDASGITTDGSLSGGTIYAGARVPTGRVNPPV